jgi:O-antigen/teichoic acid export membrane protein
MRLLTRSRMIVRGSALSVLRLTGAGASYLLQGWIARVCGPHEFGIYALCWSIVMFASAISNVGLQLLVMHVIPDYVETRMRGLAKGFLISAHAAITTAALTIIGLLLLAKAFLPPLLAVVPADILLLYLCAIPVLGFFYFWMELAIPLNAAMLGYGSYSLVFTFLFAALVTAIALIGDAADARSIGIALNIAVLSSLLFLAITLGRRAPLRDILRAPALFDLRRWYSAIPAMFVVSALEVAQRHVHVLIGSIWLSPSQLGVLYAATRSAFVLDLLYSGYSALYAPIIAQHYHANDMPALREAFRKSARALLAAGVLSMIVCILGGRLLLTLFGSEFTEGYATLIILSAAISVRFAFGPCLPLCLISNMRATIVRATTIAFLTNALVSLLLVPRYGLDAAAVGPALGMVVWMLITVTEIWRRFRIFGMFGRS